MQPVLVSEIKNLAEYELERDDWRPLVMALKDRRRVRVGGHLTFLFENHDTVRYQIQEMIRIERIVKAAEIAHEVETYNELIPAKGELSASLLVEYETPAEREDTDPGAQQVAGHEDHAVRRERKGQGEPGGRIEDLRLRVGDERLAEAQAVVPERPGARPPSPYERGGERLPDQVDVPLVEDPPEEEALAEEDDDESQEGESGREEIRRHALRVGPPRGGIGGHARRA